jgi:hypothetical protein
VRKSWLFYFLLLAAIGAIVGLIFGWAYLAGLTIQWQSLGAPPEKPVRILAASSRGVWVESISRTLYVASPQGDWSESTGNLPRDRAPSSGQTIRIQPKPLNNVVDSMDAFEIRGDNTIYTRYALRADGSVFLWQDWPRDSDRRMLFTGPAIGAFLGVWFGFLIILYRSFAKLVEARKKTGTVAEEILKLPRFGRR